MWEYRARLSRPYDGDSFWVLADTGYGQRYEPELRLFEVYAPELHQLGGGETRQYVNDWFGSLNPDLTWPLFVRTVQTKVIEPTEKTTFSRYVAIVHRYGENTTGVSLNDSVNGFLAQHPDWPRGKGMAA
jgi:hypothetical protein